jgi:hypothetical protein
LTSSPTPETHVRVACAWAREERARMKVTHAKALIVAESVFIRVLLTDKGSDCVAMAAGRHVPFGGNAVDCG